MTQSQIKWAAEHDWFIKADGGDVVVNEVIYNPDTDEEQEMIIVFSSFTDLKNWAGY